MENSDHPWKPRFYTEQSGASPVEVSLSKLTEDDQKRILWAIGKVCEQNIFVKPPLAKHLEDKLWELCVNGCMRRRYRLIFVFAPDKFILLLHIFEKDTNKTLCHDKDLARKRYMSYLSRKGITLSQ